MTTNTENLTILFTDIVGFTEKTSRMSREQQKQMLSDHDRQLLPILKHFGGRKVKSVGDGMLVSFKSPTDAVHCAMAMHDQLHQYNKSRDSIEQITIRAALNVGEVQVERNDVFGDAVNTASRLEGITPAGEVYLTQALYLAMNRAEVSIENVGAQSFKGVDSPIDVFRVIPQNVVTDGLPFGSDLSFLSQNKFSGLSNSTEIMANSQGGARRIVLGGLVLVLLMAGVVLWQTFSGHPDDVVELKAEARAMLEANQLKQADELASEHLKSHPEDVEGLVLGGHVKMARGATVTALEQYARAIEMQPDIAGDEEIVQRVMSQFGKVSEVTDFIRQHQQPVYIDYLVQISAARGWSRRHAAIALLEELGEGQSVDRVKSALADLAEQEECEDRLSSIRKLRQYGDERALPVLQQLADVSLVERVKNHCYRTELTNTIAELQGREVPDANEIVVSARKSDETVPESGDEQKKNGLSVKSIFQKLKDAGQDDGDTAPFTSGDK